jgi:hypothetical protein
MDSLNTTPKHVFVSGPPRAGTTLLRLVLSAHPLITVTPETHLIGKLFERHFAPGRKLNQNEMEFVIQLMRSDVKLNSWPAFYLDEFLEQIPRHRGLTVAQVLDSLFRAFAKCIDSGTDYLGNKKGLYATGYGPYTKRVFPDAKFIYTVRDPRDVTRSILENLSGRSLVEAAATCSDRNRHMIRMRDLFPDDVLIVRYEDLVSEPEQACRRVCDFLGAVFDERMLTFYEANPDFSLLVGATRDIHPHTISPFNPGLIGQWKKILTIEELQTIEAITRDYMKRYGYKPEALSGGLVEMTARFRTSLRLWYRHFRKD